MNRFRIASSIVVSMRRIFPEGGGCYGEADAVAEEKFVQLFLLLKEEGLRVKVGNAGGKGALAVLSPAFRLAAFGLGFGNVFDQIGRKRVVVGVDDVLRVPACGVVRGRKEKKIAGALIDAAGILRGDEGQGGIEALARLRPRETARRER
ncbi:MAG: hypothetical protein Q4E18_09005 [Clostridia bacterium]|nr:hypothetical protein [Clostridia bacterium]